MIGQKTNQTWWFKRPPPNEGLIGTVVPIECRPTGSLGIGAQSTAPDRAQPRLMSAEHLPMLQSAGSRLLVDEVAAGRFRADLFHRIAGFKIRLPPLRERLEDLEALVRHILAAQAKKLHGVFKPRSAEVIAHLAEYDWPFASWSTPLNAHACLG